jgi:hypothetical protein
MCFSRRIFSVAKKLNAKTSQITVMAIAIGHSSSAYSFDIVNPSGSVIAADTMIACHPQKWIRLMRSLYMRTLQRRCVE